MKLLSLATIFSKEDSCFGMTPPNLESTKRAGVKSRKGLESVFY